MNRIIASLLFFFAGLGAGYFWGVNTHPNSSANTAAQESVIQDTERAENRKDKVDFSRDEKAEAKEELSTSEDVPDKVLKVLSYIDENGEAPEGYVGGRKFKNLEGLLPKKDQSDRRINYQEWDVNPKIEGQNRGKERLVTGDDLSAYYTNDHYQSFKKIK
jgi:ribonuclease T1